MWRVALSVHERDPDRCPGPPFELPVVSNAVVLHLTVITPLTTNDRTPCYDRELVEAVRRRVTREG